MWGTWPSGGEVVAVEQREQRKLYNICSYLRAGGSATLPFPLPSGGGSERTSQEGRKNNAEP